MRKPENGKTNGATAVPASATVRATHQSEEGTDSDVSRRAFELYEARGRDDGQSVEDWLQAERELRLGRVH